MFSSKKNDTDNLLAELDKLEEFIKDERNSLSMQESARDKNLQRVESKILSIANLISEKKRDDLRVFGEIMLVCEKLSDGYTDDYVTLKSSDDKINYISYSINEAVETIHSSLEKVVEILDKYRQNDYRDKVDVNIFRGGQFKELLEGINELQGAITSRVLQAYKIGMTMEHQSDILQREVSKLNKSTELQTSSVKETVESIDSISRSIHTNTKTTEEIYSSGKVLEESASKSLSMIEETKTTMEQIDNSTQLVNDAIRVISQIAFQTNILSLNAAVEAATAGEAGRGFAVVAGEVRNLANKSAESAQTIQDLMDNLKLQTNQGKNSAIAMGEEFHLLNENIDATITRLDEIVHASQEQKSNIEIISESIKKIDEETQSNSEAIKLVNEISIQSFNVAAKLVNANKDVNFDGKEATSTPDEIIESLFSVKKLD